MKRDEKVFPNLVEIKLNRDVDDPYEEPNRYVLLFTTSAMTKADFIFAVRDAVNEWIETNPDDFAASVSDTGTCFTIDTDCTPEELLAACKDAPYTWDMVYSDLPDHIAHKHGFSIYKPAIVCDCDEYDDIRDSVAYWESDD
jgi:predicted AlkP superfamily pyrophosphatase or phosphodiesterase